MPQAATPFAIRFILRDMAFVEPWGTPPDLSLSWFALTDGAYCIETPAGRLLEYREGVDAGLGVAWCTYAVARLFEDLRGFAAHALEPVPEDIPRRLLAWLQTPTAEDPPEDDALYEAWIGAQHWWGERQLDLGYLRHAPHLDAWRVGDMVHLRWCAREASPEACPFTVWQADVQVPAPAFERALVSFETEFLAAMRLRCEALVRDGWQGKACEIDPEEIQEEQTDRELEAAEPREKPLTDWVAVRKHLDLLGA